MTRSFRELVAESRKQVPEVTVEEVKAKLDRREPFVLLDVRDPDEYREGHIEGAQNISRGFLEFKIVDAIPEPEMPIVLHCLSGLRSLLAGQALKAMGFPNVSSMAGGYRRWKELGLPFIKEEPLRPEQMERYSRHFMLAQVGEAGQKKLLRSKVLLIGAGGLGSPAALYLAAAGVGTLGIIDNDVVDLTNLHRQVIHGTKDVGRPKVESARETIADINPDVRVVPYHARLTVENVEEIIRDYDVILDGSDNFDTKYLLNDACFLAGKPLVHGAIFQFEGMVSDFIPGAGPCYRCLYPTPPPAGLVPS